MPSLMFQFEKDEWAEDHGIQVGHCNIHNVKVWDGDCEECDSEGEEDARYDTMFSYES